MAASASSPRGTSVSSYAKSSNKCVKTRPGFDFSALASLAGWSAKGWHAGDAKDFKEVNPERLALAVFIGGLGPGAAEGERAGFDFVPGEGHGGVNGSFYGVGSDGGLPQ